MATILDFNPTSELLKNFYKKSDDPENHDEYADFFTDEAILKMGLRTFKGRKGSLSPTINERKLIVEKKSLNFVKVHGAHTRVVIISLLGRILNQRLI